MLELTDVNEIYKVYTVRDSNLLLSVNSTYTQKFPLYMLCISLLYVSHASVILILIVNLTRSIKLLYLFIL